MSSKTASCPVFQIATSSQNKLLEYRAISGWEFNPVDIEIPECPAPDRKILCLMGSGQYVKVNQLAAERKARFAYDATKLSGIFVESTFVYDSALDGFPGPFVSDLNSTEGRAAIINLLKRMREPEFSSRAVAISTLGTYDPVYEFRYKTAVVFGKFSPVAFEEENQRYGCFEWDSIFIPDSSEDGLTFSQMGVDQKNLHSPRRKIIDQLLKKPILIR